MIVDERLSGVDILARRETAGRCPRDGRSTYRDIVGRNCLLEIEPREGQFLAGKITLMLESTQSEYI